MNTAGPWSPNFDSILFPPLVLRVEGETDSVFPYETSHCHYGFHIKYLFPFVPIYYLNQIYVQRLDLQKHQSTTNVCDI